MTTRDIRARLREMYDIKVPTDLISRVTDAAAALDAFTRSLAAALPSDRQVVAGALGRVHPIPGLPPEVRKVIYTTNP